MKTQKVIDMLNDNLSHDEAETLGKIENNEPVTKNEILDLGIILGSFFIRKPIGSGVYDAIKLVREKLNEK